MVESSLSQLGWLGDVSTELAQPVLTFKFDSTAFAQMHQTKVAVEDWAAWFHQPVLTASGSSSNWFVEPGTFKAAPLHAETTQHHDPEPPTVAAAAPPVALPDDRHVEVGGIVVTVGQVRAAITILATAPGNAVTGPLTRAGHPLAAANWLAATHQQRAWSSAENKPVGKRDAVLCHLRHLVDPLALGPLWLDLATGYTIPVTSPAELPADRAGLRARMREIVARVGNGRLVGRGASAMDSSQQHDWLIRWLAGDLAGCYQLEATVGQPSIHHPGHPNNPHTHRVIWRPAVPGEIPAGVTLPGDWPSPKTLDGALIGAYLVLARAAHPEQLSHSERRWWVRAHLSGDKSTVDVLSLRALERHNGCAAPRTTTPAWIDLPELGGFADWAESCPELWPMTVLRDYVTEHQLASEPLWDRQVAVVEQHRLVQQSAEVFAACRLHLKPDPDQPTLAGYHRKVLVVDQHGRRWLFKAAPEGAGFRADTEHAAHGLARAWGYNTAESRLVTFDNQYGQIQGLLPVHSNLLGYAGTAFESLTLAQLCAIAREHILDWAIDNDDSHGENIVLCSDGAIAGIDKGRAWRYFGGWQGLAPDHRANSNCQTVYVALYDAIAQHTLPPATVAAIYHSVIGQARRMQRLPDDEVAGFVRAAVEQRPHYKPSSYQTPVPHAPEDADELVTAAVARKNRLVEDMEQLWAAIYHRAGWAKPNPHPIALPDNPQGHQLHAGLHGPDLHAAVLTTKSYGTSTFVAGTEVEDAHVLLWRERPHGVGHYAIRGHLKVRDPARHRLHQWCANRATTTPETKAAPELPGEAGYYHAIIAAAKTVSYHREDQEFNQEKLTNLHTAVRELRDLVAGLREKDTLGHDEVCQLDMATRYLGYTATIAALKTERGKSKEGDFPRYVYTPAAPEPVTIGDGISVELVPAQRPAAHQDNTVRLQPDGELRLDGTMLRQAAYDNCMGHHGDMFRVTLPTGETIEYRTRLTDAPLAIDGQLQFTIPDAVRIAEGLHRIDAQLTAMGLILQPATPTALEVFYWRHLAGVMDNRADSNQINGLAKYKPFWAAAQITDENGHDEIGTWRAAFALLVGEDQVTDFIATGAHLPRFMHFDLRHPTLPGGQPYWMRIDAPAGLWRKASMPTMLFRSGPVGVLASGMAASTEARIRHLAIWKSGQSSTEDMNAGSSSFVFTRQHTQAADPVNIWLSPHTTARTHNYAYNDDRYGRISDRSACAPFDYATMTAFGCSGNELLIKHAVSLLDDIEVLAFDATLERDAAVANLNTLGISQIRGVPVAVRFIRRGDAAALRQALAAARASYLQDW